MSASLPKEVGLAFQSFGVGFGTVADTRQGACEKVSAHFETGGVNRLSADHNQNHRGLGTGMDQNCFGRRWPHGAVSRYERVGGGGDLAEIVGIQAEAGDALADFRFLATGLPRIADDPDPPAFPRV